MRPNILLVHWHDVGRHLGTYGWSSVPSPRVDALAAEGTRFDDAFCTAPMCSPARGSLYTGRYPHSNGLMALAHLGWEYHETERRMPEYLSDAGYRTALFGMQHESRDATGLGYDEVHQVGGPEQYCVPVTDLAEHFLLRRAADLQPFHANVGFFETHRPYPEGDDHAVGEYHHLDPDEVEVPGFLPDNADTRRDLAGFLGAIRLADEQTGRLLDALEEAGLANDTWVIFTTDHGMAFPRAKSTLFDPGLEVALIMRYPTGWRAPPEVCSELVSHTDVLPTVLEMLDLPVPETIQGRSVAPWLRGEDAYEPRDVIFGEKNWHDVDQYDPVRCVRTRAHKYIRSYERHPMLLMSGDIETSPTRRGMDDDHLAPRAPEELYDLRNDPHESTNLAGDPAHEELRGELDARLEAWRRETDDPLLVGPLPAPHGQTTDAWRPA